MAEKTELYSTNFLSSEYEKVNFQGCSFRVYRKRASPKVFTVSFWKSKAGYVFNLAHSLFWWAENLPILYPDYNIRLYFDNSVFSSKEDTTEWIEIMRRLLKIPHIELWFFYCGWASNKKCIGCHKGTFGSLIRFHAFDDPETEVVLCRNLEYLSSPRDADRTNKWIESGKPYHWYCYWTRYGQYGCMVCEPYKKKGLKLEPNMETTLMATFSYQKKRGQSMGILGDKMIKFLHQEENKEFIYGIDEYILTIRLKEEMTLENTFITDFINDFEPLAFISPPLTKLLCEEVTGLPLKRMSFIFQNDPDKGAKFIQKSRKFLEEQIDFHIKLPERKIITRTIEEKFHGFLFSHLKDNKQKYSLVGGCRDFFEPLSLFIAQKYELNHSIVEMVIFLSIFENSIFNCIDFPGFCVKDKDFGVGKHVDPHFDNTVRSIYFNSSP